MDIHVRAKADSKFRPILAAVGAIYCAINLALPRLPISGTISSYVLQPLLWGLVIWVILRLPKYKAAGKLKTKSAIIQLAFIIGFLQVVLYLVGGLFSGFGKSPSSFTPLGILTNLILVGSMLIGMELSRAWLINHAGKHTVLVLAFVAVLYTVLSLPLMQLTGLKPAVETISFVNSTLLPTLAENLLASLLALLAGPLASIAYRGMILAFWWFCPILPDLSWALKGLIGIAVPVISLAVVRGYYVSQTQRTRARQGSERSLAGWVVTAVLSVALIWFSVGLFPIHPTLVGSGSMSPLMNTGDVVLIAKTSGNAVKLGDIIEFRTPEKINIMHRVVRIEEKEGSKLFITKGDANDAPDSNPVTPENVVGKVFFTVPKVGWITVVFKGFIPH